MSTVFKPIDPRHRPEAELDILCLWDELDCFRRSVAQRSGGPRWVFYEGPPTANGRPHVGHLIPRIFKDVFPRFMAMKGYQVERKGGWDTHGLPVELEVEKALGLKSKQDIERYGVERFVRQCKESVFTYKQAWEEMVRRLGFWIDLPAAYVTMTDDYIESLWWGLAEMHRRGLLYEGHKVVPYCPRCGTSLSSHEVAQGYREVEDPSVYVRFPLLDGSGDALLVWTTTPWTLPANVAVAVNPRLRYVRVTRDGQHFILGKAAADRLLPPGQADNWAKIDIRDYIGKTYTPPFANYTGDSPHHIIVEADFVTEDSGTSLVHIAPAFGEDDYKIGQAHGLPVVSAVGDDGRFTDAAPIGQGKFVKDADPEIIADLRQRGLLHAQEQYKHEYPHCWRCQSPLIYYARHSWFVRTTALKSEIIAQNEKIGWHPEHTREGRFGDFLRNMVDWGISRSRYWGTPLPIWRCRCARIEVVESRARLIELARDAAAARKVELHKPWIDDIVLRCPACAADMRRVSEVADCWYDSGMMHTAQHHLPFENQGRLNELIPCDFIAEAQDQTRGWFYTLLVTGTILYGRSPYKNVICTGLGLDGEGQKMSKSKGNVVDPMEVVRRLGADPVRWYMAACTDPWNTRRFADEQVQETINKFFGTLRNTWAFFVQYANIDGFDTGAPLVPFARRHVLDRWILARLTALIGLVDERMQALDVTPALRAIEDFVDDLSNWYVRGSRARFWKSDDDTDKLAAHQTLFQVLVDLARLIAPAAPFLAEEIYQNLARGHLHGAPDSVHLTDFPRPHAPLRDEALCADMARARQVAALGLAARNQAQIKVRQPLSEMAYHFADGSALGAETAEVVRRELNVKALRPATDMAALERVTVKPDFKKLGPKVGKRINEVKQALAELSPAEALGFRSAGPFLLRGLDILLQADEVIFGTQAQVDLTQLSDGQLSVYLATQLDETLRAEGLARELVSKIQQMRKELDFELTDRVQVKVHCEGQAQAMLRPHIEVIMRETLAQDLVFVESISGSTNTKRWDVNDFAMTIGVHRP